MSFINILLRHPGLTHSRGQSASYEARTAGTVVETSRHELTDQLKAAGIHLGLASVDDQVDTVIDEGTCIGCQKYHRITDFFSSAAPPNRNLCGALFRKVADLLRRHALHFSSLRLE